MRTGKCGQRFNIFIAFELRYVISIIQTRQTVGYDMCLFATHFFKQLQVNSQKENMKIVNTKKLKK